MTIKESMKYYEQSVNDGFSVTDARQYYENGNAGKIRVETKMQTPYEFQGQPVQAYAVVAIENQTRSANTLEFWQNGRNLEDVMEQLHGTREVQLQTKAGEDVDMKSVREQTGTFAIAASEYPHVFTYDEYVESRNPVNERLQLDPPNEQDYERYLESVERQMESGDIKFVGRMTNTSSLHEAYMSMPSVQADMEQMASEEHTDRAAALSDYDFEESDMSTDFEMPY